MKLRLKLKTVMGSIEMRNMMLTVINIMLVLLILAILLCLTIPVNVSELSFSLRYIQVLV